MGVLGLLWFASIPGRLRRASSETVRIPDLEDEAQTRPAPRRISIEVRNITLEEQVVDLTTVEAEAPAAPASSNGATGHEAEVLPSVEPRS